MLKQCEKSECQNWFEPKTYRHGQKIRQTRFCSRSCANSRGPMSEEDKEIRRKNALKNPTGWAKDPVAFGQLGRDVQPRFNNIQKEERACLNPKCSNTFTVHLNRKQHIEQKYCSTDCRVECSEFGGYNSNSTIKHRSIYKGYQMDSGAELYFAKIMDKLGIKWIKNDNSWRKFFYFIFNGKKGKYYPDFYLPQANIWIEIKGRRYIRQGDEERRASVPQEIFLLISNDFAIEFNSYIEKIKSRLK